MNKQPNSVVKVGAARTESISLGMKLAGVPFLRARVRTHAFEEQNWAHIARANETAAFNTSPAWGWRTRGIAPCVTCDGNGLMMATDDTSGTHC
eukprot:1320862-Pleurochrysis_carterae.AAC.1